MLCVAPQAPKEAEDGGDDDDDDDEGDEDDEVKRICFDALTLRCRPPIFCGATEQDPDDISLDKSIKQIKVKGGSAKGKGKAPSKGKGKGKAPAKKGKK